jgi:hypothetical protein
LEDVAKHHEGERTEVLIQARERFLTVEEGLRRLDRVQAVQRERALARLAAAAEAVRPAPIGASRRETTPRVPADLEQRLDRLSRDVSELRRAVERLATERGRAPGKE